MTRIADEPERWQSKRAFAITVRLLVLFLPIVVSVGTCLILTRVLPSPRHDPLRLAWLGTLAAACGFLAWPARMVMRRLLPLAALLEMSLLFPGEAPTRWKVAREAGSIQHLDQMLAKVSDQETSHAATTILALVASLARHDKLTGGHSNRVRVFTDLIAKEMGLSAADRDRLRWAALIHDVGKLVVPVSILNKPGKPTPEEWEILKQHPDAGAQLIAPLAKWLGPFAAVVVEHHERFDGTGYPAGLSGSSISQGARIVALADAFEVMTASRPYKKPMTRPNALREVIRCSGTHFDPVCVRALLAVSLPRLNRALGPASWLSQVPVIATASVSSLPAVAGGAALFTGITGAVLAGTLGSGGVHHSYRPSNSTGAAAASAAATPKAGPLSANNDVIAFGHLTGPEAPVHEVSPGPSLPSAGPAVSPSPSGPVSAPITGPIGAVLTPVRTVKKVVPAGSVPVVPLPTVLPVLPALPTALPTPVPSVLAAVPSVLAAVPSLVAAVPSLLATVPSVLAVVPPVLSATVPSVVNGLLGVVTPTVPNAGSIFSPSAAQPVEVVGSLLTTLGGTAKSSPAS